MSNNQSSEAHQVSRMEISEIQNQTGSLFQSSIISVDDQIKIVDRFLSILRSRSSFLRGKCDAHLGTSRYLTNGDASLAEKDYGDALFELYLRLERANIHEIIAERLVNNRIVWDIAHQNVNLNDSFPLPRPAMQDRSLKDRQIITSMVNIANTCTDVENLVDETLAKRKNYLVNLKENIVQLEKFRLYKESSHQAEQVNPAMSKNKRRSVVKNFIDKTNTIRGMVTDMIGNARINYFEHPELVEVIRKFRRVETKKDIIDESKSMFNNLCNYE